MVGVHIHQSAAARLPLSLDVALAIIGVGTLVLLVVAYDAYRTYDWEATGRRRDR
jgi:hypothetical protein